MEHLCPVHDDGGGVCKATAKCFTKRLPKPQRQRKEARTTKAALERQPHWQYVAHVWLNIVWRLQRGNKQQVALSKEQTNWNLAKFGVAQLSKKRLLGIVDQKLTATYRYALRVTSPY